MIHPAERENHMRVLTAHWEAWIETGVYDLVHAQKLVAEMEADDLVSLFAYATNTKLKQMAREALATHHQLNPDGTPLFDFGLEEEGGAPEVIF